jgi:mycothiol synthase
MISVAPVDSARWTEALSLLFSRFSPAERDQRVAEVLGSGELDLTGLLIAEADGKPFGAGLYAMQADKTAFVWPPGVSSVADEPAHVADAILQEVGRRIDAAGAWLGQCLLEPDAHADRDALTRNGFAHFADLSFLLRSLSSPLPPVADIGFETVAFNPATNAGRFADVLEQTYIGTLDCPRLGGLRSGAEALAGHRLAGRFSPDRWKIYRVDNDDVGVLLLTDHPDQNTWEVVYMGIVPAWRGRGLGRAMLLAGLHDAQAAGTGAVTLAVDTANNYAKKIYEEVGFVEIGARAVHIRVSSRRAGDR